MSSNIQKFVMLPMEKFMRLTGYGNEEKSTTQVAKDQSDTADVGKDIATENSGSWPPPGVSQHPTVRWLTLSDADSTKP